MWTSYLVGIATIVTVAVGWLAIQRRWRGAFLEFAPHADALAARGNCRDCALPSVCKAKKESS